jgi:Uma2 family endonuclease
MTFEDYLSYDDGTDNRYELVDGELVELPPESEPNSAIVDYLFLRLVGIGLSFRLIKRHNCEVQVPVLQVNDTQNRFPDLVVLRPEHLALTQKRLTIKLDMPPPQLVVEVVSPGRINRERDYKSKREQYERVGIPEYWIIDPEQQAVTVLKLAGSKYSDVGMFKGNDAIVSETFPQLILTPAEVFAAAQ